MIRRSFPFLTAAALALSLLGAGRCMAGSFFGPSCYGAAYHYEYPNRSHNVFGCGPCCHCVAWHPLCPRLHRCKGAACAVTPAAEVVCPQPPPPPAGAPPTGPPVLAQPH